MPVKASVPTEFDAVLTKCKLPVEPPATCGVKVTVKERLCPAGTVAGKLMPLSANPWPFHDAEETVTSELVADSTPFSDLLLPTSTVPKLKFEGVTLSCAAVEGAGALFGMAAPPPQASCSAEAAISSHKRYRPCMQYLKGILQERIWTCQRPPRHEP